MALPMLHAYHLEGLQALIAEAEGPAVLAVHGVASLSEAMEVYALADAAARERGWEVQALPNLARLAGVATEFDRLTTSVLPRLVADPARKDDLLILRSLALSVRHDVRRLDGAGFMRLRVLPLANRLVRMARRVIRGQSPPASLADLLPAVALEMANVMEGYYVPVDQGPPPRVDIHDLPALVAALNNTDGRAELAIHSIGSLTEALGTYDHAAAAVRERGWIVPALPDLARLASLAVEVDHVAIDLLPRVAADPTNTRDLFALKSAASTVRRHARRVESTGQFRASIEPLMTRIMDAVGKVMAGQAEPALLAEVLPAARDEINVCASTYDIPLPGTA